MLFLFFIASPVSSPIKSVQRQIPRNSPCCTALYDFEAENPGELGFKVMAKGGNYLYPSSPLPSLPHCIENFSYMYVLIKCLRAYNSLYCIQSVDVFLVKNGPYDKNVFALSKHLYSIIIEGTAEK